VKPRPRSDYPVGVRRGSWEVPPSVQDLYEGSYLVTLNHKVEVDFVPDVSADGPPFRADQLPADVDAVTTRREARLAQLLLAGYAVTPHDGLAGSWQELPGPVPGGDANRLRPGVVVFTSTREFAVYTGELAELAERLGSVHPPGTVADLLGHRVIGFLRSVVLRPPVAADSDLAWLRDPDAAPGPGTVLS